MAKQKRKKYTGDFKAKVLVEALTEGNGIKEVAQKYAISPVNIRVWKALLISNMASVFDKKDDPVEKAKQDLGKQTKDLFDVLASTTAIKVLDLSEREKAVLKMLWWNQMDVEAIAVKMELTTERIRQIYREALIKLKYGLYVVIEQNKKFEELNTVIKGLKRDNSELKRTVERLKPENTAVDTRVHVLKIDLLEMKLSERLRNCLISANIRTIGDLQDWDKRSLLKLRNFGVKCLSELDGILERYNVQWWK